MRQLQVLSPTKQYGTYVELKVLPESIKQVITTIMQINDQLNMGFEVEPVTSWHCTVMYSTTRVSTKLYKSLCYPAKRYAAHVVGFDFFGPESDTLVLLLESPKLNNLHTKWKLAGCTPTYKEYKPHLTLKLKVKRTPKIEKYMNVLAETLRAETEDNPLILYRESASDTILD